MVNLVEHTCHELVETLSLSFARPNPLASSRRFRRGAHTSIELGMRTPQSSVKIVIKNCHLSFKLSVVADVIDAWRVLSMCIMLKGRYKIVAVLVSGVVRAALLN
jgi:hypothetical protein